MLDRAGSNRGGNELSPRNGKHVLYSRFSFSFMRRTGSWGNDKAYGSAIKTVGSFGTVEDFWAYYSHLVRPNDLPASTDLYLFREGILPMWEDAANKFGGRWSLRLRKGELNQVFEYIAMGLVGEQIAHPDAVCGITAQIRFQEDGIAVWTKNSVDLEMLNEVRDSIKRILGDLDPSIPGKEWEFKPHVQSH
eukprot:CAMPEP_0184687216 /NCGR_PEP_ID=MMETSP0312-20130426/25629_1 /TAXON_ID=31354 /ORGANISM="Compsopogon coeruleus, Strain SAG 36.94" /LENGTH=191 /DNA_ID=CAMNT_0027143133 /DNA_START=150 /DNA_END=725 /DNA_ORIENTATION=+